MMPSDHHHIYAALVLSCFTYSFLVFSEIKSQLPAEH
jgi:hypothetical protein